jgi:hypothetical protein
MKSKRCGSLIACVAMWFCGLCLFAEVRVEAQSSSAPPAPSASSELIGKLTKELSVTPRQARGGAGTLFSLAKSRLSTEEFGKVSSAVPGMNGLLKAAPALPEHSEMADLESSLPGGMGRMAEAAEAFHKLGMSPEMAGKFLPVMTKFVEAKGGLSTAALLEKALK